VEMAEACREQARRLRELYERERNGGSWGIVLLPALARVWEQMADDAEVARRPDLTDAEVEAWAVKIWDRRRVRRRTEWEFWVAVTFGGVLEDAGDPWVERTFWLP
jgi:hypothetical protein